MGLGAAKVNLLGFFSLCCVITSTTHITLSCTTDNFIDGSEFVNLTLQEIKEIVPPLGLAKKIAKLIPKVPLLTSSSLSLLGHLCIYGMVLISLPPSLLPTCVCNKLFFSSLQVLLSSLLHCYIIKDQPLLREVHCHHFHPVQGVKDQFQVYPQPLLAWEKSPFLSIGGKKLRNALTIRSWMMRAGVI